MKGISARSVHGYVYMSVHESISYHCLFEVRLFMINKGSITEAVTWALHRIVFGHLRQF
jgi:hypothetical protein